MVQVRAEYTWYTQGRGGASDPVSWHLLKEFSRFHSIGEDRMLFFCFQDVSQCHTLIYFPDFCRSTSKNRGLSLFPASNPSSCTVFFLVEVTRLWGLKNTTFLFVLIFTRKDMKQMGIVEAFLFFELVGE